MVTDQKVTDLARYASPLRYPGGKAKLAPFVKEVFECNNLSDGHYAEPYAGGAGLALTLLFDDFVRHIHINDLDRAVHAFWWSVLNEPEGLCQLITDTPITPGSWERQRRVLGEKSTADPLSLGFATFFLNRTSRSGIVASGGMIGGKGQSGRWGIDARYNVRSLIARIQRIASFRSRISLTNLDALDFLAELAPLLPDRSLTYLDPPYYVKGQRRLYANYYSPADHESIAGALDSYPHCWLTSYDYAPEILSLYSHHRCHVYSLQYTASTRRHGAEAIFFSDDLQIPPARPLQAALPAPRATCQRRSGWSRRTVTLTALGPMLAVAGIVATPWIQDMQRPVYLRSHLPAYERVVAEVEAVRVPPVPAWQETHGVPFVVDSGPPLQVAFPWPEGLVDDWVGVIHDRTGVVRESQRFQPDCDRSAVRDSSVQ